MKLGTAYKNKWGTHRRIDLLEDDEDDEDDEGDDQDDEDDEDRVGRGIMHSVLQLSGMLGAHLDLRPETIMMMMVMMMMIYGAQKDSTTVNVANKMQFLAIPRQLYR